MIRRQIASSLLAWACVPLAGWAQPVPRRARIAVLGGSVGMTDPATMRGMVEPLRKGLRDLGWIEGRNLDIEWRFAEGKPLTRVSSSSSRRRAAAPECLARCQATSRCHQPLHHQPLQLTRLNKMFMICA